MRKYISKTKLVSNNLLVYNFTYDGTDDDYDFPIASWCKTALRKGTDGGIPLLAQLPLQYNGIAAHTLYYNAIAAHTMQQLHTLSNAIAGLTIQCNIYPYNSHHNIVIVSNVSQCTLSWWVGTVDNTGYKYKYKHSSMSWWVCSSAH